MFVSNWATEGRESGTGMSERDPRTDPRPGDYVEVDCISKLVTRVYLGKVYYTQRTEYPYGWDGQLPAWTKEHNWRKWAAKATVVRRGEG